MCKYITITCTNEVHAALMQYMQAKRNEAASIPGAKVSMSNYANNAIRKSLEADGIAIAEAPKKVPKAKVIQDLPGNSPSTTPT